MEKRNLFIAIGVLVVIVLVIGAVLGPLEGSLTGSDSQEDEGDDSGDSQDQQRNYTVKDATGEEIEFKEPPERIVSFMPSNTELLFHLEVGDRVVGVDDYSNYPEEAKELPKVGDSMEVDYEKIVDLEPDVVVITEAVSHMKQQLEEYELRTFVTGGETLEDVYSDLRALGEMCGVEEKGEEKAQVLEDEIDNITEETRDLPEEERIDVLYISGVYQGINTPGEGTFQNTLLTNAGADNIASDKEGWTTISEEEIISRDPEVIIAPGYIESDVKEYTEKDSWQNITAVEKDQVYFVNGDVMSRPGPRVVEAQQTLVDLLDGSEKADTSLAEAGTLEKWSISSTKKIVKV
ncbi:MAG: ABC transporter substrate-binding protein [Candidatus Thermoplasmatota archaeon]|nr:ABC transporter substrate-binding protein [Candidatus Thermoplasmatota archaeon]